MSQVSSGETSIDKARGSGEALTRYYRNCFDREMAEHGLTRSQWWLLAHLQYNE